MIRLEGISREFQVGDETVHALHHVDLELNRGDYYSIMGPSGSGKSTLLNILGLLDRPNNGHYWLDDIDTITLAEERRAEVRRSKIGFVFQAFHLVPRLTAAENVELPMTLAGIDPQQRKQRVHEALEPLGLLDRASHRPDQLSGGQRQRVAIARATIMQPTILLADEPTGNLDKSSGQDVIETLEQLNSSGLILLVVTHDPEIGRRARHSIQMEDGAIINTSQVST
jgi:putative ABC transport system ATP-binding protein